MISKMRKIIMKGVQDIRTLPSRMEEGSVPYKLYMKLSMIEMEKFRRGKEKQSALDRVNVIDQRFREIEADRQKIITALKAEGIIRQCLSGVEKPLTIAALRTTTWPFKIRY